MAKKIEPLTYSVSEAAKALGVSTGKMYDIVRIKGFPAMKCGDRTRVSIKGLEEWVDAEMKKGWHA